MLEKTIHRTGLTILSYYNPQFPSFAISYTLKGGSKNETLEDNGVHHFIEHMIFKGSKNYDLKQIAEISDRLGGSLNAFTGKERTQFYSKAIDEKFDDAFDLFSDIVFNSTFPDEEFIKEKNVILQEIKESIDSPDTHSFETFYECMFKENSFGYPIAGTEKSVGKMSRDFVYDYYKRLYQPKNILLTVSGNIKHEKILEVVDSFFEKFEDSEPENIGKVNFELNFENSIKKRDIKQLYTIIGFKGLEITSEEKYSYMIANDILGAGMSSRLFQSIREDKGLAYTISSFPDSFFEGGIFIIYSIIEPERLNQYLKAINTELQLLITKGVSEKELKRAKDHIKSSVILGLESNMARMRFMASYEIYKGYVPEIQDVINDIDNTTKDDVNRIFSKIIDFNKYSILCYGNYNGKIKFELN